jgi:hypothetical protein
VKLKLLTGAALVAMLVAAPARAERTPSVQIRCDGLPDNVTAGETAARLLGAVTLLGIFAPSHETPDESLRLAGAEGVAICAQALQVESNEVRRAQLILATAIHRIEAGDYDAAIAEARRIEIDRPAFAQTAPFRRTLWLGAMEIEALALLSADRLPEARARAFEMANAAPYDLLNMLRAWQYIRLTSEYGERERAFFDAMIPLYPGAVLERAAQRQLAGDFRGAAADYDLWIRFERSLDLNEPAMLTRANAALAYALAGDTARAATLAEEARQALTDHPEATAAQNTTEVLDLYNVWKTAHDGNAANARLLFAGRTAWLRPAAGAVAEVARLLQQGVPADSLTGTLAGDPNRVRTELVDRRRREVVETKNRFLAIRGFYSQAAYDRFSANVWRTDRSRYFQRDDNERLHARLINTGRDGFGAPAGYALLLHSALVAHAQGKSRFMVMPAQSSVSINWVRFGNEGDENIIAPLTFETNRVIADLTPVIGRPVSR